MNQNQIQQLTSHLSQALDQNYDVVNMEAVLSVICALEGTTITKEQLEATRLAKYINQLRRRTKNDQLARRAKSLLKKWREMVGIHQTPNDSQSQPLPLSSFKPVIGVNITESETNVAETVANASSQPSPPPSQRVIADLHSNIDSSEPHLHTAGSQQQHTNFSSLINNNINIDNSQESFASKPNRHQRTAETKIQKSATFINEASSNSASNVMVPNEKLNEASIVIDIVSDSDENDSSTQPVNSQQLKIATAASSLPLPAFYPRPKKIKKDKKRKERDARDKTSLFNFKEGIPQQSKNVNKTNLNRIPAKEGRMPNAYPTDPEILSLSNSSMSSILSGDAVSGNLQSRLRTPAADLTFAGRFKSVQSNDDSSVQANGQKIVCQVNQVDPPASVDLPMRQFYDEYMNNDSSTSCSRLSPYEEVEGKPGKQGDETIPKKRGRKKGSKGVDSLIAKESSLSQQIFFGSGVKKVKTTKELFNDIQSRKLSILVSRGESLPAGNKISNTTTTIRNREPRSLQTRPTSSCSETSAHSPQTLEAYSTNASLTGTEKLSNALEDAGNTDSETITSEPSRDSMKSRDMKRTNSLDSNSNSVQTLLAKNVQGSMASSTNYGDVTTQLMHIVRSLNNPLSVSDTEQLYQSQIVPCTCIIVEDMPVEASEQNNPGQLEAEADAVNNAACDLEIVRDKKHTEQAALKTDHCKPEEATPSLPPKPMKSIFDLDFDDDDDPLQTIIKTISPNEANLKRLDADNDNDHDMKSEPNALSPFNDADNQDIKAVGDNPAQDEEAENVGLEPVSVYTVHEDPHCVAKQRFDVQTNDVTQFHINALHNYYVPNINGNWNSIDSSLLLTSTLSDFMQTLESYTVTDGADVVPKYGSLTYERIRKDLSCLKFVKSWKTKSFKSFTPPFLGVAKCLPTCRLAAKRLKDKTKALSLPDIKPVAIPKVEVSEMSCNFLASNPRKSPSPLRVEVNTPDDNNDSGEVQEDPMATSYNLLKLANNNEDLEITETGNDNGNGSRCRSLSSCSNSSLQLTQNSINAKLRNQRTLEQAQSEHNIVERNRKKRRKAIKPATTTTGNDEDSPQANALEDKPRIKRIKIAINGNVATQRQISHMSSSEDEQEEEEQEEDGDGDGETRSELSDAEGGYLQRAQAASEDEHEHEHESYRSHSTTVDSIAADDDRQMEQDEDNNSNNNNNDDDEDEEYAIVQRPMLGAGSNHIVLTIKKTPSKINSPVNSVSAISPSVGHASVETGTETGAETVKNNQYTNSCYMDQTHSEMIDDDDDDNFHQSKPLELDSDLQLDLELDLGLDRAHACLDKFPSLHSYNRYRRRRRRNRRPRVAFSPKECIDLELKHLFDKSQKLVERKTHRKLFFTNEICMQDSAGHKQRILNYSSSSSSDSNDDDDDVSDPETETETDQTQCLNDFSNNYKLKNETDPSASAAKQEDLYLYSSSSEDAFNDDDTDELGNQIDIKEEEYDRKLETEDHLPLHNNHMLPSFNTMHIDHQQNSTSANERQLQIENCDDVNICYNNNNLSLIKTQHTLRSVINDNLNELALELASTKSELISQPATEYRTGIRAGGDTKNSNNQIQQFKEWHEVLQLQSYNNEPLIVLPYVVLE